MRSTSDLNSALLELERAAEGTTLYSFRRYLLKIAHRPLKRLDQQRLAAAQRRGDEMSGEAPSADFLPSPLPPRPACLFGSSRREIRSRRRQHRFVARRAAYELTEWQVCLFGLLTLRGTRDKKRWAAKFKNPEPSSAQIAAFDAVLCENLRFCRLRPKELGPGRGAANFRVFLDDFEQYWNKPLLKAGAGVCNSTGTSALPVVPSRVVLPEHAGCVDPARLLPAKLRDEFLDVKSRVRGDSRVEDLPKFCYRVAAGDEPGLRLRFLESQMAVAVPVDQIPRTTAGRPLLAGLFGVIHKDDRDRLIFDRRPANHLEHRLRWSHLPYGPQLCRLVLDSSTAIRCSGDDLRSYFYYLANAPDAIVRNAFGRAFDGAGYERYGTKAGTQYLLCLRTLAMGDLNAVDIAHESHRSLLQSFECMQSDHEVVYGQILPDSRVLEGLYIDDHFVIGLVPKHEVLCRSGPDLGIIERSHKAYEAGKLLRAEEKGFGFSSGPSSPAATNFTVIGTEIRGELGLAGAPLEKRRHLFSLGSRCLGFKSLTGDLVRRLVALYVHPLMHRRELMCLLSDVFGWISGGPPGAVRRLPHNPRQEMIMCTLCLPLAEAHLRWPVSRRLAATDATPTSGGAVHCFVSDRLARTLYRASEQRGCYTRLDSPNLVCYRELLPPDPTVGRLFRSLPWVVHRSRMFRRTAHVNLQELRELIEEVRGAVRRSLAPARLVLGLDSFVSLGAWSKGRSSSKQINTLLRESVGWQVLGRKCAVGLHVESGANPGDAPSRFKDLEPPLPLEPWMLELLGEASAPEVPRERRRGRGEVRECFAGAAGLSEALAEVGLSVASPLEAFPVREGRHVYDCGQDLCEPSVYEGLISDAKAGRYVYIHFGLPCRTWGPAGRLAGGTRRVGQPWGDGSLGREIEANRELRVVVLVCAELALAGVHFTVENPLSSYAYKTELFQSLCELTDAVCVDFDQCCYGLAFPDSDENTFCKKPTRVVGSSQAFRALQVQCPGIGPHHQHVRAWGSVRVGGKVASRTSLAGRYPPALCRSWALASLSAIAAPAKVHDRPRLVALRDKVRALLL